MKPRTLSFALAVGLFLLALWLVFRPERKPSAPDHAVSQPVPGATAAPVIASRPTDGQPTAPGTVQPPGNPAVLGTVAPVAPNLPGASPAVDADVAAATAATANGPSAPRDARIDANKVHVMLRDYHTLTGGNPVGTNAEIMKAVMGGNPKQATLGPPEGMSLNGNGELLDQWGTPYFFHQLSRDVTEIRSAGPDKAMYTADDILTR